MNYEEDIRIDETALDIEWLDQPKLMMKYGRHQAQCKKEYDEAKQKLDIVSAEVDKKIRENPERYIDGKVTEGSIKAVILTDKTYQAAQKEVLEAKYEMDIAQAAINAFDQRKTALENMVKLHGLQYFAGPKIPRDISWQRANKDKTTNQAIGKKMIRKS